MKVNKKIEPHKYILLGLAILGMCGLLCAGTLKDEHTSADLVKAGAFCLFMAGFALAYLFMGFRELARTSFIRRSSTTAEGTVVERTFRTQGRTAWFYARVQFTDEYGEEREITNIGRTEYIVGDRVLVRYAVKNNGECLGEIIE